MPLAVRALALGRVCASARTRAAPHPHRARVLSTAVRITTTTTANRTPKPSERIQGTDEPCIIAMQKMLKGNSDALSLAQGIVHWKPPQAALEEAAAFMMSPRASQYGPDIGLPELREALKVKLKQENGLANQEVMVTAGANQAFMNVVLTLLDQGSRAVLFAPYYFNHLMALQMTGARIDIAGCDSSMIPDMDELEKMLAEGDVTMVVVCNPCNPSGVVTPRETLERCAALCKKHGAWLVMDNTYEHFTYEGAEHVCIQGDNVINMFSFSKAYGMMGWRVGYLAFDESLVEEFLKAQDTIPVCASITSQLLALKALEEGRGWVEKNVASLETNRNIVKAALKPLGDAALYPSNGAIYMWVKLPEDCPDDKKIVEWLASKHGVVVIPGSACGVPGHVRIAYANQPEEKCAAAAERLERGLHQLVTDGLM